VRLDNGSDDLSAALHGDIAPLFYQLFAGDGKNTVAFAQRGPIQPIGLIQKHLMR
jgi:hypothetical protein